MSSADQEVYPIGQWIGMLADERPDDPALIFAPHQGEDRTYSWRVLDRWSNQLARLLQEHGVGEGDRVVLGLPNSPEMVILLPAVWKLGAQPVPIRGALPPHEYNALLEITEPAAIVADWTEVAMVAPLLSANALQRSSKLGDGPLPTRVADPMLAIGTGGSTGRPKLIEHAGTVVGGPRLTLQPIRRTLLESSNWQLVQLVCGPLYHIAPLMNCLQAFIEGSTTVLMERFDAARSLDLIEQYRPRMVIVVPTMMQRMLQIPDIADRDLSSLELLFHTGAPCPPVVKQGWIDLIGAERVVERYGGSEGIGGSFIRGDEWLEHPSSVGKPVGCDLRIIDDHGNDLPVGEVGLIYTRPFRGHPAASETRYIGADQLPTTDDGFMTLGDLGWLDEDGYLYIADRRTDMIVTGGANVYPAEVEAILSQASGVADVVVVGVPDGEWGRRVHAIVQPLDHANPPTESELDALCREHLAAYKVPKTYEYLPRLPRNAAGKIRRSALVEERSIR